MIQWIKHYPPFEHSGASITVTIYLHHISQTAIDSICSYSHDISHLSTVNYLLSEEAYFSCLGQ